jgi:type 1 glutamine amidotransferase/nicotinamidase-related amidase
MGIFLLFLSSGSQAGETLRFYSQERVETAAGVYELRQKLTEWDADKTAIVVCDMWDRHWCKGATSRVGEMAPVMEDVLNKARKQGVLVIHAPSSTMDFYEESHQRKAAQNALLSPMPSENGWRHIDDKEGPLPIDDSDGGCDDWPACENVNQSVWSRQINTLSIGRNDFISDRGQEVYNILEAEGRENVIVMGVHVNMCVLGRPFSIRANVSNGKNVVLMKDLTDSMYNSRKAPFVDHHRGTELVVEHIEKHWAPSVTSSIFTGAVPFRFAKDERKHAVFLIHEKEYDTKRTVPAFAKKELEEKLGWKCTYLFGDGLHNIPGTEVLEDADLIFVSVRRQILPESQMKYIKAYCESGKPVVGIRTASHAFAERKRNPNTKGIQWPEFDQEILGGNYHDHYNNKDPNSPRTYIWSTENDLKHPIMAGATEKKRISTSWLYKVSPVAKTVTPMMWGQYEDNDPEPVAWTNIGKWGNRVFYTSLGHPDDFESKDFRRMLANGVLWAVGQPVETESKVN